MRRALLRAPGAAGRGLVRSGRGVGRLGRATLRPIGWVSGLLTRSPEVTLALLALVLFVVAWSTLSITHDVQVTIQPVVALVEVAPLVLARLRPFVGWATSLAVVLGFAAAGVAHPDWPMPWPVVSFLVLLALVAAVGLRGRWQEVVATVAVTGAALAALLPDELRAWGLAQALVAGVAVLVRWLVVSRRQLARETETTQEERARRAVLEERSMIARELHDVVAHHMSLIVVQSQSAPYRLAGVDEDARAEFASIEQSARAALDEVRSVLGVLRSESHEAASAPVPGATDLHALLESGRAAGLPLTWAALPADLAEVPTGAGLAAYRILQESLANAARHAPGAAVAVSVTREDQDLVLAVENTAPPRPSEAVESGGGSGLLGARTRAETAGGTLAAGPTPDGGFRVEARLPARAASAPSLVAGPVPDPAG